MRPLLFVLLVTGAAHAASETQTHSFPVATSVSGTGSVSLGSQEVFTALFAPFNPALGTLQSYAIVWDFSGAADGVVSGATGSFSLSYGGTYYLGSEPVAGGGAASGANGSSGQAISRVYASNPLSAVFLVSEADLYPPELIGSVTGNSAFEMSWDTPLTLTYTNVSGLNLSGAASVSITYNYAAVPEPSVTGLMAAAAAAGLMKRRRKH